MSLVVTVIIQTSQRLQILNDRPAVIWGQCRPDYSVAAGAILEFVAVVAVAWLGGVVEIAAFELGRIVPDFAWIKLLGACPESVWPVALRREQQIQVGHRAVVQIR